MVLLLTQKSLEQSSDWSSIIILGRYHCRFALDTHSFPEKCVWLLSIWYWHRWTFWYDQIAFPVQEWGQLSIHAKGISESWHHLLLPYSWNFYSNLKAYNSFLRWGSNILQVLGFGVLCKMSPIELMSWVHKSPNFKLFPWKKHKGLLKSFMIIQRMDRLFHTKIRLSPQSHCSLVHLQCSVHVQLTEMDISDHSWHVGWSGSVSHIFNHFQEAHSNVAAPVTGERA